MFKLLIILILCASVKTDNNTYKLYINDIDSLQHLEQEIQQYWHKFKFSDNIFEINYNTLWRLCSPINYDYAIKLSIIKNEITIFENPSINISIDINKCRDEL